MADNSVSAEAREARNLAADRAREPWTSKAEACRKQDAERSGARSAHIGARPSHSTPGNTCIACLTILVLLCYRARLSLRLSARATRSTIASILPNIFGEICHELYAWRIAFLLLLSLDLSGQIFRPALPSTPNPVQVSPNPNRKIQTPRPDAPPKGDFRVVAIQQ